MSLGIDGPGRHPYQAMPEIELADVNDPAIAKYAPLCGENDFASPLSALIAEAETIRGKTWQEKEQWILEVYTQIVEEKIGDPMKKEIALRSGPSLIRALNDCYSRKPIQSYYSIQYDTSYADKINPRSVELTVGYFERQFGARARDSNPIPFFYYAFNLPCRILWHHRLTEIRNLLLDKSLKAIFPEGGDLEAAYREIYPAVAEAFSKAYRHEAMLHFVDWSESPDEDETKDCCCIIL